jgi:hypothetical protein
MTLPIEYIDGRPVLKLEHAQFHRLEAGDIRLPSGEEPGFLLQGETYRDWAAAASAYNDMLKEQIFQRKWQDMKKSVQVGDILEVPFPLAFQGGNGKDNAAFEFYSAPAFADDQVVLIHFRTREEAQAHFAGLAGRWEERKTRHRKESMDNIFRGKGWKVK